VAAARIHVTFPNKVRQTNIYSLKIDRYEMTQTDMLLLADKVCPTDRCLLTYPVFLFAPVKIIHLFCTAIFNERENKNSLHLMNKFVNGKLIYDQRFVKVYYFNGVDLL
jgi:hypothetical protein